MAKQGSVLLVVLMILSLFGIVAFTVVRNTVFLTDGALVREHYEQQYRATEGLVHYGIALAQCYFDAIKNTKKETKVEVGPWPFNHSPYQGRLLFIPEEQKITVQALLQKEKQTYCSIVCQLSSNADIFEVHNWKIG